MVILILTDSLIKLIYSEILPYTEHPLAISRSLDDMLKDNWWEMVEILESKEDSMRATDNVERVCHPVADVLGYLIF